MSQMATQYFDAQNRDIHFLSSAAFSIENDVSYEVSHLETMVAKSLRHLQVTCAQMEAVEKELRSFLDEYYGQVGHYFEQLEMLKREIAEYDRKIYQAAHKRSRTLAQLRGNAEKIADMPQELPSVPLDLRHNEWEAEMKDIYRRLVKLYHPDVAGGMAYSTRVLQLINQAYEKRNLWAMREVEHSLVEHAMAKQDTPQNKLCRLRERYDAIAQSTTRAMERKNRLMQSEAWALKQRLAKDRYVVEVIIHRVKQYIAHATRLLAQKRVEYQAALS